MNDSLIAPNRERDRRPIRFLVFGIITILVFGTLTTRLAYLQITNGEVAAVRAEAQRTEDQPIPATRGLIYDRQGRPLVNNVATWAVKITPSDLPFSERDAVSQRLANLLGIGGVGDPRHPRYRARLPVRSGPRRFGCAG